MLASIYGFVKRAAFGMPLTIALGIMLGVVLAPVGTYIADLAADKYDSAFPVLETHGTLISSADGEAVIAMSGKKNRDCSYIGIRAYALGKDGNMTDAYITRIDAQNVGATRPVGSFIIGTWRVWPLPDSRGIAVYVTHLCGARIVLTKMAEVDLPKDGGK